MYSHQSSTAVVYITTMCVLSCAMPTRIDSPFKLLPLAPGSINFFCFCFWSFGQASLADGKAENTIRRLNVFRHFYKMVRRGGGAGGWGCNDSHKCVVLAVVVREESRMIIQYVELCISWMVHVV